MTIKSIITVLLFASITLKLTAQNIGIGSTSAMRAKLELNGMIGNTSAIFGANSTGIGLMANWPMLGFNNYYNNGHRYISSGYSLVQKVNPDNGIMIFETTGSGSKEALASGFKQAMVVANNGHVGIGIISGLNAQLNVVKDADKDASAFFSAPQWSAFNYGPSEYTAIRGGANQTKLYLNYYAQNSKIVIGVDGSKVGINSGGPVYPLEIRAPDFAIALMRMGSLNQWIITVSQYYLKLFFRSTTANNTINQLGSFDYSNGSYYASSDRRLKKNITPLPPALQKIMQLQTYSYTMKYNNANNLQTMGLMAQEVKEIFPSLVHVTQNANTGYDNIKDLHTLNYSGLAPIIIKALQEQHAQLLQLEERAARLEKQ